MTSIYYCARRDYPITETEQMKITGVLEDYWNGFAYQETGESFSVFEYNEEEPNCIFEGATKLPYTEDVMEQWEACQYWMECLTAVTRILSDAAWEAALEGVPFQWEKETGWRVMSDDEYQRYSEREN